MFLWNPQSVSTYSIVSLQFSVREKYYLFILVFLTCPYNKYWNQDTVNVKCCAGFCSFSWVGCWELVTSHPFPLLGLGRGLFSFDDSPLSSFILWGTASWGSWLSTLFLSLWHPMLDFSWTNPGTQHQINRLDPLFGVKIAFWYEIWIAEYLNSQFHWMSISLKHTPVVHLEPWAPYSLPQNSWSIPWNVVV